MTATKSGTTYPSYKALLEREGHLAGTSWGLFPDAGRGTPSFIGPDSVRKASTCIRTGTASASTTPPTPSTPACP